MHFTPKMITIDCLRPRELAEWWATALGVEIAQDLGPFVIVAAEPLLLGFQQVPEGKPAKNRVHIDFASPDRTTQTARLVAMGATFVAEHTYPGLTWTVLQDPEANEFCVSD